MRFYLMYSFLVLFVQNRDLVRILVADVEQAYKEAPHLPRQHWLAGAHRLKWFKTMPVSGVLIRHNVSW